LSIRDTVHTNAFGSGPILGIDVSLAGGSVVRRAVGGREPDRTRRGQRSEAPGCSHDASEGFCSAGEGWGSLPDRRSSCDSHRSRLFGATRAAARSAFFLPLFHGLELRLPSVSFEGAVKSSDLLTGSAGPNTLRAPKWKRPSTQADTRALDRYPECLVSVYSGRAPSVKGLVRDRSCGERALDSEVLE
jgi:hypothetical protein